MRNFLKVFAALALLFQVAGSNAFAQTEPPPTTPTPADATASPPPPITKGGFFENLENSAQQLSQKFNKDTSSALKSAGMGYAEKMIEPALAVAGGLALMYLFYEILMALSGKGQMAQVIFDVGVPAMVTGLLIANYAQCMALFNGLLALFENIGGGNPAAAVMQFYGGILGMLSSAIATSFTTLGADISFSELFANPGAALGNIMNSAIDAAVTIFFALVILIVVFASMAEVLGLLLLGPFLYAIGVAFGPLLLAGMVTPWTRDYVGKWVGFLVGAAVVTGVLTIVISITLTIFSTMGFNTFAEGKPTATALGMVAVMVMAVNSLISQTPSIASALIPGTIGAKSGGGASVTRDAQNMGKQAMKSGGAKGARGAGTAVKKTGSVAVAAYRKLTRPSPPTPLPLK